MLDGEQKLGARIRVLHVVLNLHEGGLERVLGDLVRGIDPLRFESHILALQFLGRLSKGLEHHATLHVAGSSSRWSMLWPSALAGRMRRIAPDVVHTHSGVWFKGSLAARMAGVPVVVHTDHGRQSPDPWHYRLLDGLASRRTDVVVAVSDALGRQLAATVVHNASRIRVVRNGVDTERFRKVPRTGRVLAELGIAPNQPVLGSIGRLDPIKRFDLMLQAFAELLSGWRKSAAPALIIAGDGPERSKLEALVNRLGLERHAHLLGWREDVQALHAAFSLFTMSSRSEGTSIALLEAMSAELCPVVTDVGGNAAVLGDELRHRLCAPENSVQLRLAWEDALGNPSVRDHDAKAARRRVEHAFSVRRMIKQHEEIYADGLHRARDS